VSRTVARLAALVVGLGLGVPGAAIPLAPASAESCTADHGVSVVVDFHQLGGGLHEVCDPDGGGRLASRLFSDNGFTLAYVQRQPGFVCQVSGEPESPCVNTPPADAYWSFWSADRPSDDWSYATRSVDSVRVPDGGRVALSWSQGDGSRPPGTAAGGEASTGTTDSTGSAAPQAAPADQGVPVWVAPGVILVLAAVAGAVVVVRRRSGGSLP